MRPPLGVGKREDPQIFGAQSLLKEGICLASKESVFEPIASIEWLHRSDPAAEEENKSSGQPFERRPPASASDGLHQNGRLESIGLRDWSDSGDSPDRGDTLDQNGIRFGRFAPSGDKAFRDHCG